MGKKDFLQNKYEEINKLKNMLQDYPNEYKENIIHAIDKITDEINGDLEKKQSKATKRNRQPVTEYTLKELEKFNGVENQLAYVAIDGTVYDVTPIKSWFNGNHYGLKAGLDLSEFFNTCHSKEREILKRLRVVGTLKQ